MEFVKFSSTIEGDDTTINLILYNDLFNWECEFKILYKDVDKNKNYIYTVGSFAYYGCADKEDKQYNCRTFAKHYKQLIDKSARKDSIYAGLPKPKNL